MAIYSYKVLRRIDGEDEAPGGALLFCECGDEEAKTPDAAALSAAEKIGKTGSYRSISARHFNETEIVPTTGFAIGTAFAQAEPPPGDTTAELDPRLDSQHACGTEECGHLPAEHGAKGLGICRVDDCPCGKYEPAL